MTMSTYTVRILLDGKEVNSSVIKANTANDALLIKRNIDGEELVRKYGNKTVWEVEEEFI